MDKTFKSVARGPGFIMDASLAVMDWLKKIINI